MAPTSKRDCTNKPTNHEGELFDRLGGSDLEVGDGSDVELLLLGDDLEKGVCGRHELGHMPAHEPAVRS